MKKVEAKEILDEIGWRFLDCITPPDIIGTVNNWSRSEWDKIINPGAYTPID